MHQSIREEAEVCAVNACLRSPAARPEQLLRLLEPLGLPPEDALSAWSAPLYLREMAAVQREQGSDLSAAAVRGALRLLPPLAAANAAVAAQEPHSLWQALTNPHLYIMDLDESCCRRYLAALLAARERACAETPHCPFITHQTLQRVVDDVNADCQAEDTKVALIEAVNLAVESGDSAALLTALTDPALGYSRVSRRNVPLCLLLLQNMQQGKLAGDGDGIMWLEEIDECVRTALVDCELAERACAALTELNGACPGPARLAALLQLPCLGLQEVSPSLADHYQRCLSRHRAATAGRQAAGGGWVRHSVGGACEAFLNLDTAEVVWAQPDDGPLSTVYLGQAELQAVVWETNDGRERPERWLVPLQAACRGLLLRRALRMRRQLYAAHTAQIVRIQAWWRGARQRRAFLVLRAQRLQARMENLQREVEDLRSRQQWEEQLLQRYRPHEAAVARIQRWWRRLRLQYEFRQLATAARPSVPLLRRFVHLLDVRDFREEIQLQKAKGDVAQMIRKNQILEKIDVKIGLLVKNRITLQEVLMNSKSVDARSKGTDKLGTLSRAQGLKALTREARERLALYQQLFYQLQTRPAYLARLVFALPPGQSSRFLEQVVLSVFNYGANDRQEYLLINLFRMALQEEVRSRVERLSDIVTGNPMVVRMLVQYSRRHSLRPLLGPLVERVLADRTLSINTNPVDIYRHWINQQETHTGQPCGLPYTVSQEDAMKHGEVAKRLSRAIACLKEASAIFLDAICAAVDRLPYCLLYSARVLRAALQEKFPQAAEKDILKVVGNLIYYRFINSAIVAPDAFDIVTLPAEQAMTPDQRRNLGSIAKILQFAASKKGFGEEAGHLQSLNPFIISAHERFKEFVRACCAVREPEQHYGRNEFTEATLIAKPIIYITKQELYDTHRLLVEYESSVAPDAADPLHEILEELGDQPSLDGNHGEDQGEQPAGSERAEVCLTLQARETPVDDSVISTEKLFLQCKQLLVDVMRCTEDGDVSACARAEPTALQERGYRQLLQARGDTERRRRGHQLMHRNNSFLAQPCATLEEVKDALLERLRQLERAGRVDREDNYRALLEAVAADILHQKRRRQQRRQELVKLARTLAELDQKRAHHQEQARYYTQYLATCLQGMAAGRRHKPAAKVAPLRYTAARLKEKGVLLGIEGMQPGELKGVQLEISPLAAQGTFQVNAKLLGVQLERVEISLQELLQLQYDGVSVMNMFGRVRINVNLLIFLLNNKFYGKHK